MTEVHRLTLLHAELDHCRACPDMIGPVVHGECAAQAAGAEVLDEGSGDLRAILNQQLLELGRVFERAAVGKRSGAIDRAKVLAFLGDGLLPEFVEVGPDEPERIDLAMAELAGVD